MTRLSLSGNVTGSPDARCNLHYGVGIFSRAQPAMNAQVESIVRAGSRRRIGEALVLSLADSFTLAMKTQAFAWNVTGPFSAAVRPLFQDQYQDLMAAITDMAIRIRVLGMPAPSAFSHFSSLSGIQEEADVPEWRDMVSALLDDQQIVSRACAAVYNTAELFNDTATLDLMTRRITRHDRNTWELRALLE